MLRAHASADPAVVAARLRGRTEPLRWLWLSPEYREMLRWERALADVGQRIDARSELTQVARELREPFLELIAELGRAHDSPEWWTSRVSERNTMVSPLFLNCCYEELIRRLEPDLVVVSDAEVGAGEWVVPPTSPPRSDWRAAAAFVARWWAARRAGPGRGKAPSEPVVGLRTWVDEASFAESGFRDRYFDGLAAWLEQRGQRTATIPVLFNIERSAADAWRGLSSTASDFIHAESHYRLADVVWALRAGRRQARMDFGRVELAGADVTRLFEADRDRFAFDTGSLDSLLCSRLPKRLRQDGWQFSVFLDLYENLAIEKGLILGFRAASPETRVNAFQHGALSPLLLSSFVTAEEARFAPLPDTVVCNGEFFRDLLVLGGLPRERTRIGAALRYPHLAEAGATEASGGRSVLVTLPLVEDAAVELLVKLRAAFPDGGVSVALKPHPMSDWQSIQDGAGATDLPQGFELVGGGMEDSLRRAAVVVSLASSTLYEALAAGVPVVVVGRESALDLNPLDWEPHPVRALATPDDIRAEVLRWLNAGEQELEAYRVRSREALRAGFAPATDEALAAFVD